MDLMENFLPVRDFQNAVLQNLTMKKLGLHVRTAEKRLFLRRRKRAENIMGVLIIQNVILCHGSGHPQSVVKNVIILCWKKGISLYVVMMSVAMCVKNRRKNKGIIFIPPFHKNVVIIAKLC